MDRKIVFMGSPDFALPTLNALHKNFTVVGVVTQPDALAGRGRTLKPPAVKVLAQELGLPLIQPPKLREPEAMAQLRAWNPDCIVVAAFGQLLRQDVLDLPPYGCINVHASLLPRWRGAAPIHAAVVHGDAQSGVTIMKMAAGLDTGPILSQRAIPLAAEETAGTLFDKLSQLGGELLVETLPAYFRGEIQPKPQPEDGVTHAPTMDKSAGELDFTEPAEVLERKVRGHNPWPGAYTYWQEKTFKIHKAHVIAAEGASPGERTTFNDFPAVGTSQGLLVLDEVQPAGKKAMPGDAFLLGARDWGGTHS